MREIFRKNFFEEEFDRRILQFLCLFVYLFTYSWRSCILSIEFTRSVHSAPNSAAENRTRAAPTVEQRYSWTRKYLLHRSRNSLTLNLLSISDPGLKGSPYPSHFIFDTNVGNNRIRHRTTLKLNDEFLDRLQIDWKFQFRIVICRIRLFPTLISIIKWLESEQPLI